MNSRAFVLDLAKRWLGVPYRWGGDDPMAGFDCSGFVVELLKSVGILGRNEDLTAEGLRGRFPVAPTAEAGRLVFWGGRDAGLATHVELLLDDTLSIGASGGGSKTQSLVDAVAANAYIKVRPWSTRGGTLVGFADPFAS